MNDNDTIVKSSERMSAQSKGNWLSENVTQLMVFLNGLILSITAFATLTVFIQQIVQDELYNRAETFGKAIEEEFIRATQTLELVAFMGVHVDEEGWESAGLEISQVNQDFSVFDTIHLAQIHPGRDTKPALLNVYQNPSAVLENEHLKAKMHEIGRAMQLSPRGGLVMNEGPENFDVNATFMSSRYSVSYRPLFMWARVPELSNRNLYTLGSININRLMDNLGGTYPNIGDFTIDQGGEQFFSAYKTSMQEVRADLKKDVLIRNGQDFWLLSADVYKTKRETFLEYIPVFMLLFGLTLTTIGTMYVRNNYRQSKKLSNMNKILAAKNLELNSEIAERERLNQVIVKAERENRAIVDSVNDIIFELDNHGRLAFLNETWEKITGYGRDEYIGLNLFDLLHPQDREEHQRHFKNVLRGYQASSRNYARLKCSLGSYRAVELALSMQRLTESGNVHVVGTITDVEERQRAEKALAEAEKKYRTIVENAAGGIYQMTGDGLYLSANPALARILGYDTPGDVLRMVRNANVEIYVDKGARSAFLSHLLEKRGGHAAELLEAYRKDGKRIWLSENARAVTDDSGAVLYYEGSIEDVTERKVAEQALQEAKLNSDLANRAKSEFLANMSHELRTPLNSIIGFSDILKGQSFGPLGHESYYDYANEINSSGRSLLKVINEILDVARIDAGDRKLNESIIHPEKLLRDSIELLQPKLEAKKAVINISVPEQVPAIIGEDLAIKQMVNNLLSNAIKFSHEGVRIQVGVVAQDKGDLCIYIEDNGIGMSSEEVEKALSPFGQINSELSRSESGTGLGLTLVSSLIKLHDGRIEISSKKDVGTKATLVFPAARVSKPKDSKAAREAEREAGALRPGKGHLKVVSNDKGRKSK